MSRIALTDVDQQPEAIRQFMARRGELNVFRLLAAPHAGWAMTPLAQPTTRSATQA